MNQREIKFRVFYNGKEYDVFTRESKHRDAKGWHKRQGYIMRLVSEHHSILKGSRQRIIEQIRTEERQKIKEGLLANADKSENEGLRKVI